MHTPRIRKQTRGFTLIEIQVSIAVLALLLVMFAQLMNCATSAIGISRRHIDADSQARLIFDRLDVDFSRMVMRSDIDYHLAKISGGSDEIAFYTEGSGYYSEAGASGPARIKRNTVSIVGYRVRSDTSNGQPQYELERVAKGLGWEPNAAAWQDMAYLPITLISGANARWPNLFGTSPVDADFQAVSDQVFRFEYTFLLSDGTLSSKPIRDMSAQGVKSDLTQSSAPGISQDSLAGYAVGSRWFDTMTGKGYICLDSTPGAATWGSIGVKDVGAMVVALAILDPASRQIVSDYAKLAAALPDAPAAGDIATSWEAAIQNPSFAESAGLHTQSAASVRVYQRYFTFPASP